MATTQYKMVRAKVYSGFKNVLFMLDTDDVRLKDSNYVVLGDVTEFDLRTRIAKCTNKKRYLVFGDRSARQL